MLIPFPLGERRVLIDSSAYPAAGVLHDTDGEAA